MYLKKTLSFIVVLSLLIFFIFTLYQNRVGIINFPWRFNLLNLLLLIFSLLPIYLCNILAWHLTTKALGSKNSYLTSVRIWLFSNISRFIPGGIWQYAGRIYLAKKEGMPVIVATSAILIESLLTVTIGIMLSVLFLPSKIGYERLGVLPVTFSLSFVILLFLVLTNKNGLYLLSLIIKKIVNKGEIIYKTKIPFHFLPILILSFGAQFFIDGALLFFLSRFAIDLSFQQYFLFVGIFSISWIIGYLTFLAPSGLGVQELTLTFFLSQYMPFSIAGTVAILFRILLLLSEVSTLMTYLFLKRRV